MEESHSQQSTNKPGINLTKKVTGTYAKEIDGRWRDHSCSWTGSINIVKTAVLLKVNCRFNAIHIKTPMQFFPEIEKKTNNLKVHMEIQKTPDIQNNHEQ